MMFGNIFFFTSLLVYRIVLPDVLPTGGVTTGQECLSLAMFGRKLFVVSIKAW